MAKHTIKMACGHEETVQLYGSMKERENRIAYLEQHGMCSECYKAEQKAEREKAHTEAMSNVDNYPTLEGSEKQISWAIDIRQKWIDDVNSFLATKNMTWEDAEKWFCAKKGTEKEQILDMCVSKNPLCKFAQIITNQSAIFYIDNRDL